MTLGENIRKKREEMGLSLRGLSKKVGISPVAIGRYEKDLISPSVYVVWDLADFFGCSIDELCGRKE